MVQTEKLKQALWARGLTDERVAWHLGISEQCWQRKLERGRFGTQDVELLRCLLGLECPEDLFFTYR